MKPKFLVVALLGMATVLLGSNKTQAQSYFWGYYYPESHRFHTNDVAGNGYDSYDPVNADLYELRYGPKEPVTKAQSASVRLLLPDANAKVFFDGTLTKTTGKSRLFVTPPIEPGTYTYHIKVSWMESGREVVLDRDVEISPGHTVVLNMSHSAATTAKKTTAPAK